MSEIKSSRYTITGEDDDHMRIMLRDLKGHDLNRFNNEIGDWKAVAIFESSKYYDYDGGNTSVSNNYYTIISVLDGVKVIHVDMINEVHNFRPTNRIDISSEVFDATNIGKILGNMLKSRHKKHKKGRWVNAAYHIPSQKVISLSNDILSGNPILSVDWKVLKAKVGPISGEKKKLLLELIRTNPSPVRMRENSQRWYRTSRLRDYDIIVGTSVEGSSGWSPMMEFKLTKLGINFVNKYMDAGLDVKNLRDMLKGIKWWKTAK